MQVHEFFGYYANTPLDDRTKLIKMSENDPLTLDEIFFRVKELEDKMRPDCIERDKLIEMAVDYWDDLTP